MAEKHTNRWLERVDDGDVTVVRILHERLQIADTTQEIFDQIYALVDDVGREHLVLNLGKVEYVSSLALGKLVNLNRRVLAAGGRLALCSLTPHVDEVLDVSRLKSIFNCYVDEVQARGSF